MFLLSIILVLLSSYLITSFVIRNKQNQPFFLLFLILSFSQIVISSEVLSVFKSISKINFFICNIVFMLLAICLYLICKNIYKPQIKNEIRKIKNALKIDKLLAFSAICYILFLFFELIIALFFPITYGDSLAYYLPRITSWIQNESINHFITPDTRELIMPVNMDFLYMWKLLFTKNEIGISIFSYIGYIGGIYILYNILKELCFSVRKRLWSIFVFSSFVLVFVEMYTPCADLFIGVLALASIYLFLKSSKQNDNILLYFSSLSYALAVGTKTTSIIAIPSVFILLCIISYFYKKEKALIIKQISLFCIFFIINFLIFSAYNYILNTIQFGNPISCKEQFLLNKFIGGFKSWLCSVIKYFFAIFDISGIKDYIHYNKIITYIKHLTLMLIGETPNSYTSHYFIKSFILDENIDMNNSFLGIMGILVFLPSIIKSIIITIKNKLSLKTAILSIFALCFIINIFVFSRVMIFTGYNMRYVLTFVVISSPVIVYSYIKRINLFKIILCIILFIYFIVIGHKMAMSYIASYVKYQLSETKNSTSFLIAKSEEIDIYNYIKEKSPDSKTALIISQGEIPIYYIEKLKLNGYKTDKILAENIEDYALSKYDYIITNKDIYNSTNIVAFNEKINNKEKNISNCIYLDYEQKQIYSDNMQPAQVYCKVPYEYIYSQGFEFDNNIKLEKFSVLKNKAIK